LLSSPLLGLNAYSKQEERIFQSHLICFIGAIFVSPPSLHPDDTSHFTMSLLIGLRRLTRHVTSTPNLLWRKESRHRSFRRQWGSSAFFNRFKIL
ncbi:hypothetical protein AVEN_171910-1, partial [Araneus ventricosus]